MNFLSKPYPFGLIIASSLLLTVINLSTGNVDLAFGNLEVCLALIVGKLAADYSQKKD